MLIWRYSACKIALKNILNYSFFTQFLRIVTSIINTTPKLIILLIYSAILHALYRQINIPRGTPLHALGILHLGDAKGARWPNRHQQYLQQAAGWCFPVFKFKYIAHWAGWCAKIQNFAPTGPCNTKGGYERLQVKISRNRGQLHPKARLATFKERTAPACGLFC